MIDFAFSGLFVITTGYRPLTYRRECVRLAALEAIAAHPALRHCRVRLGRGCDFNLNARQAVFHAYFAIQA